MRPGHAAIVLLCAAGCREILGLDTPVLGASDGGSGDGPHADSRWPVFDGGARVVGTAATTSAGSSFLTLTLGAPSAGDLIAVAVSWAQSSLPVTSVTDSGGSTYVELADHAGAAGQLEVFYAANIPGNPLANTVMIQLPSPVAVLAVAVEFSGLATTDPVDAQTGEIGGSGAIDSGTISTTHAPDLLVGFMSAEGSVSPDPRYATVVETANHLLLMENVEVGATGVYDAGATSANGGLSWAAEVAAFKVGN